MRIGVLLPHFGPATDYERLFGLGKRLEELGFASAWARDHLGFSGGVAFEQRSTHFVEPLTVLTAVAATTRLTVGTAALTPFRHPVVLAQMLGSLAYLAEGRLILGLGLGKPRAMELVGRSAQDRVPLWEETVDVLRAAAHPGASYLGRFTRFTDLTLDPAPPATLPVWYCGASRPALRRALERTDGWLPGRCPFPSFDRFLRELRERTDQQGRRMSVGVVPLVSLGRDRESALRKVNVEGLLASFRSKPALREDGPFDSVDDVRGALLAGTTDDLVEDLKAFEARGVDHVILDFRERMDAFEETVHRVAEDVLPAIHDIRT